MAEGANQNCDLVMKGGATSGVVYPGALQEIASTFNLVGIGGTSAGALAAVVAAAAEYRRRNTGTMAGFAALDQVADELGKPGRLKTLFRPDKNTEKLFRLVMKLLEHKTTIGDKLGLVWRLRSKTSRQRFFEPIYNNNFGLCSGIAVDPGNEGPAITTWLTSLIDAIADKSADKSAGRHLTFRDLLQAPKPIGTHGDFVDPLRSIDLRTVTTCVTFNRPVEFPLQAHTFAFKAADLEPFFPASVIAQMQDAAQTIDNDLLRQDGALPLPNLDLPIVVAARLSLSFPILFSMVPLWAPNLHMPGSPLERVWFSDGGITSNFPVHRFDSIYPRWPTLALNFQDVDSEGLPQRQQLRANGELIYMSADRTDGTLDLWSRFERDDSVSSLLGLVGAIFGSAQNWHDNAYLKLPGFRDRIAELWLAKHEGGLNLDMDSATVQALIARGKEAGRRLCARYAELPDTDPMSWRGHRWTRFRAGMAALVEKIDELGASMGPDGVSEQELTELLAGLTAPPTFPFGNEAERAAAEQFTQAVAALAALAASTPAAPFSEGPRPLLEMGSRAPI